MELTEKQVQAGFNYFSRLALHLVPGLVVLEVSFRKGFFWGGVPDLYHFVLLLTWAAVLSLPFEACAFSIAPLLARWQAGLQGDAERLRAWRNHERSQVQLLFELPLLVFYYWLNLAASAAGVSSPTQRYMVVLLVLGALSWLTGLVFSKIFERITLSQQARRDKVPADPEGKE